jgi:MoxR-like ATPase
VPDAATDAPLLSSLHAVEAAVCEVVRGNPGAVRLAFAGILARGHVLLEDVPGVGKTTLARAFARVLGVSFARVQFTADMLPSDLIGVALLDQQTNTLRFQKGPLFTQLVLADEINRASPKTQSALLEAMADNSVSVDDVTHPLPRPFHVLATQNPVEQHGAYPLPESQLDRFALCLSLGYPPRADEQALLVQNRTGADALTALPVLFDPGKLLIAQQAAAEMRLDAVVAGYLLAIVEATRSHPEVDLPCSPRGTLAWGQVCRALALLHGRDHVLPDDVKQTAHAVLDHRLGIRGVVQRSRARAGAVVDELLAVVPVPR